MTPNEELNLLLEIIKKYDLPLSPILEFAIQNKMEELDKFKNQKIEIEDMEVLLEDVFEGSNVATYQVYINGEQYKKEESNIPEGKCILTIELEDTHGNSSQKTIEVISKSSMKEEHEEENIV